jgi:tetratricopeptide (TPR) repeat protein
MWNQWFVQWLSRCPQASKDELKLKMAERFRKSCADQPTLLTQIEEFLRDCTSDNVIQWYTKDSFLFRQEDVYLTSEFQYFIVLLHEKLHELAVAQKDQPETVFYRAQCLSENELEKLKANVGNYITMNSPLSTTRRENMARVLMPTSPRGVLFAIRIQGENPDGCRQFADIADLSAFPWEEEVLFFAATVFRIDSVEQDNNSTWRVELSSESSMMDRINQLLDSIIKSVAKKSNLIELHLNIDELSLFARYYRSLANTTHLFGDVYALIADSGALQLFDTLGDRQQSIVFYQNLLKNERFIDQHKFIALHIIIGNIHSLLHQYDQAFECYGIALSLLDDHHRVTGELYLHLGDLWCDMKHYDNALACYGNSLAVLQKCLKPHHMVKILERMRDVYEQRGCLEVAHIYETEARHISEADRSRSSLNLDRSIDYYRNQLQNAANRSPLQLINTLYAIGLCHLRAGEYDQALDHFRQVAARLEAAPHSGRSIGRVQSRLYEVLAWVCLLQENFLDAFAMWKRAVELSVQRL